MARNGGKAFFESLVESAGITINGDNPWDVKVHNEAVFDRITKQGTLGLGESYIDGWWDCERLDMFFDRVLRLNLDSKISIPFRIVLINGLSRILNFQSKRQARQNISHYNAGNDLFKAMLDKKMIYSCGYFKDTDNLDDAQIAKLQLSCQKLKLEPGMRLLDIGCGWGGMAKFAAENYGVSVVGITLSEQQYELATEQCKHLDVTIKLQDYRDINESFDRIVSIGMFEHVGQINYDTYMATIHRCLDPAGLFLLHTIGVNKTTSLADEWIRKYIFPNGMLPSIAQIATAAEPYLIMEDLQNFGPDYDKTLMAWYQNFTAHKDEIKAQYDERFFRMWSYYLLSCAGGFRARGMQLWQMVFSAGGYFDTYHAPR